MTTSHEPFEEQAAAYALGALDSEERRAFEAHLEECASCARLVCDFEAVSLGLGQAVDERAPSPALKARVLAIARLDRGRASRPAATAWLAAAAGVLLAVAAALHAWQLRERVAELEAELAGARAQRQTTEQALQAARAAADEARRTLAVLAAPDLARVDLSGQPEAPRARGRAFWSRSRGLVFTASDLPPLPPGRVYQLWVVTTTGPISAALLEPDPRGNVTATVETPSDLPPPVAMAVTLEPAGGVAAPTGAKFLVGSIAAGP
jgi:anti-sigma-K factor RskA